MRSMRRIPSRCAQAGRVTGQWEADRRSRSDIFNVVLDWENGVRIAGEHSMLGEKIRESTLLVGAQRRLFEFPKSCISVVAPCFESSHEMRSGWKHSHLA